MPIIQRNVRKRIPVYVVFSRRDEGNYSFWDFFTDKTFRHVQLLVPAYYPEIGPMADRHTIKIEPMSWGMDIEVFWEDIDFIAEEYLKSGVTAVVKYYVEKPPKRPGYVPRGVITCVSVLKSFLGIRAWRIWTPWQLFVYMLCHSGQLVTLEERD